MFRILKSTIDLSDLLYCATFSYLHVYISEYNGIYVYLSMYVWSTI
jgi:hypothetical protein